MLFVKNHAVKFLNFEPLRLFKYVSLINKIIPIFIFKARQLNILNHLIYLNGLNN